MVFTLRRNKKQTKANKIDMQEAFSLWDILKSKYFAKEQLKIWNNFAHDKDLQLLLHTYINSITKNIQLLEELLKEYSIKGSSPNPKTVFTPVNPETVSDEFIANSVFTYTQEHVENLLRALRVSMTNEEIRQTFVKLANKTIEEMDGIVQYLKFKGWIDTPPLYHDVPKTVHEQLSLAEAYHLWDHLSFRYDNMKQTQISLATAFDVDFKILLGRGMDLLSEQALHLEKELTYFGIPLPKNPNVILPSPDNTEFFDDDHMFRIILAGMQGAMLMHAQALKQCTFNDRVRKIFRQMLVKEIQYFNQLVKFGKLKGWVNAVPSFRET